MTRDADEMLNIGPQELLVILVIALVVVGPQRLPELGRSIGRWMRELRKAQDEVRRTIKVGLDDPNGDASIRTRSGQSGASPPATDPPTPTTPVRSPTPTVGATPSADEVHDITSSLGRTLGQIRRARDEVQRSFRVDLDRPAQRLRPRPKPMGSTSSEPTPREPSRGNSPGAGTPEAGSDEPAS